MSNGGTAAGSRARPGAAVGRGELLQRRTGVAGPRVRPQGVQQAVLGAAGQRLRRLAHGGQFGLVGARWRSRAACFTTSSSEAEGSRRSTSNGFIRNSFISVIGRRAEVG